MSLIKKIVSGVLLLGLISSVDVFAETNAYPTNAEVSFYGEYEKPDGKIPQRFPKQSEAIPAVSGESLKHSTSKTVDQKGSGFLPRTGTKQQQMFNYLGIIVIFLASFILKKRKKEQ